MGEAGCPCSARRHGSSGVDSTRGAWRSTRHEGEGHGGHARALLTGVGCSQLHAHGPHRRTGDHRRCVVHACKRGKPARGLERFPGYGKGGDGSHARARVSSRRSASSLSWSPSSPPSSSSSSSPIILEYFHEWKPSLTSLNLEENELGPEGAKALAEGVAVSPSLTKIK